MGTCPAKDAVYGGQGGSEYQIHVYFRYQANPETGQEYGHFNFLMSKEDGIHKESKVEVTDKNVIVLSGPVQDKTLSLPNSSAPSETLQLSSGTDSTHLPADEAPEQTETTDPTQAQPEPTSIAEQPPPAPQGQPKEAVKQATSPEAGAQEQTADPSQQAAHPEVEAQEQAAVPSQQATSPEAEVQEQAIPSQQAALPEAEAQEEAAVPSQQAALPEAEAQEQAAVPSQQAARPEAEAQEEAADPSQQAARPEVEAQEQAAVPSQQAARPEAEAQEQAAVPSQQATSPEAEVQEQTAVPAQQEALHPLPPPSEAPSEQAQTDFEDMLDASIEDGGGPPRRTLSLSDDDFEQSVKLEPDWQPDLATESSEYSKVKSLDDRIRNFQPQSRTSESETDSGENEEEGEQEDSNSVPDSKAPTPKSSSPSSTQKDNSKAEALTSVDDSVEDREAPAAAAAETAHHAPIETADDDDDENMGNCASDSDANAIVIRVSGTDLDRILSDIQTPKDVVMIRSNKSVMGTVHLASPTSQCVYGTAEVTQQERITTFAALRREESFQHASREVRDLWRARLLQDKKPLYIWKFVGLEKFEKPLTIMGKVHHMTFKIPLKRLVSRDAIPLPGLNLEETCGYFMSLLSAEDLERLGKTMVGLDNCTIKVGTACSGTDIAVSVMKATFKALARHFNASSLQRMTVCMCIYIYTFIYLFIYVRNMHKCKQ